jgi:Rps23 Pro-64 3,4-dihydroxylase Tpa1-like proline 4-hydroxylase
LSKPVTPGAVIGPYRISAETLQAIASKRREDYARAVPFPHAVFDDFFPEPTLSEILQEFPAPGSLDWQRFNSSTERKLASRRETQLGDYTRHFIWELNSSVFVSFLETLSGIKGLIPDPHLGGGGLHQIERGGFLKIHADFNRHLGLGLDRRVNVLLYLNRDWKEEYGGHLELWDRGMKQCVKLLPVYNRMVVFSTTDFSFHGHPDPLACPKGCSRKSIAMYYYTNGRPRDEESPTHTTVFHARPGERIDRTPPQRNWRAVGIDFVPPILVKLVRRRPPKPGSSSAWSWR